MGGVVVTLANYGEKRSHWSEGSSDHVKEEKETKQQEGDNRAGIQQNRVRSSTSTYFLSTSHVISRGNFQLHDKNVSHLQLTRTFKEKASLQKKKKSPTKGSTLNQTFSKETRFPGSAALCPVM